MPTFRSKEQEKTRNVLGREGHFQLEISVSVSFIGLPLAENVPAVNEDKQKIFKRTNILVLETSRSRSGWGKGCDRRVCKPRTATEFIPFKGSEANVSSVTANTTNRLILKTVKGKSYTELSCLHQNKSRAQMVT